MHQNFLEFSSPLLVLFLSLVASGERGSDYLESRSLFRARRNAMISVDAEQERERERERERKRDRGLSRRLNHDRVRPTLATSLFNKQAISMLARRDRFKKLIRQKQSGFSVPVDPPSEALQSISWRVGES